MARKTAARRYWLFKSEPDVYSFQDLLRDRRTFWDGVRNYQARNMLRDDVAVGDGVLFYHSNAEPMVVAGICKVTKAGSPDPTAFDPKSKYHDPDSDPSDPAWFGVEVAPVVAFEPPLERDRLKAVPALAEMVLLQRGSRLSIQPVTATEWRTILGLAGAKESW